MLTVCFAEQYFGGLVNIDDLNHYQKTFYYIDDVTQFEIKITQCESE